MKWEYDHTLNPTLNAIMEYLSEELAEGGKFVSYVKIGRKVHKSKQSIRYSIRILQYRGYLYVQNGEMFLNQ